MSPHEIIQSQYHAALAMLRQAIEQCPESKWADSAYANPAWHVAYHTLYFTHLYLQPREEDFTPWVKHRADLGGLKNSEPALAYSKAELLDYLVLCLDQVDAQVSVLDLDAESGFHWLPFNKLELQFYNIRHIQHHTGELFERIGAHGEVEVPWVKMKG
jgi:Asp-tRNA(Asn)/Glu-tRNA(Gln) amidotransferase A subunit family amidase